jgi:hypothetical protein
MNKRPTGKTGIQRCNSPEVTIDDLELLSDPEILQVPFAVAE